MGELLLEGEFFCYTLEPPVRDIKPCAIPAGIYQITLEMSPRFNMVTPHVQNVPGFTEIEIHPGNYPQDTHGCLLVGKTHLTDYVGQSRDAFHDLMAKLGQNGHDITIEYSGAESGS